QDPISVTAQAKVPAAGAGDAVQFSAEAKTLKGEIKEYSWEFGDGATGEGARGTHEYPNGGSYKVRVTVRNSAGEEASHALGIVVPPPFLQKMNTETDVLVQAEEFKAQGGGEVSIVSGRAGALGKAITKWEADLGHWVEW